MYINYSKLVRIIIIVVDISVGNVTRKRRGRSGKMKIRLSWTRLKYQTSTTRRPMA